MAEFGLLVLVVAGIGVIQVAAFYYLARRVTTTEEPRADGPPAPFSMDRGWNVKHDVDPEASECRCPGCGAINNVEYSYCQDCLQQLPSTAPKA